jgi:P2-related tail formation protein
MLPTVRASDGAVMENMGRYSRGVVKAVFESIGGVERMAEWADENPGEFYTKLFAKTITRETEIGTTEGVEALLERLDEAEKSGDVIDAEFEVLEGAEGD